MDLILHHYDFSNFAEKARLMLGFKGLAWKSVEQPPILDLAVEELLRLVAAEVVRLDQTGHLGAARQRLERAPRIRESLGGEIDPH